MDLERNAVVDLLPDRKAETLAAWLRKRPGVEIVARDRASAYAESARDGAPDAVQVADRWHMLRNLGDAVHKAVERQIGSILTLLGLDLAVPDHSTLSRRAETSTLPPPRHGSAPVHLLVDSTGLKLCGAGEWLLEKHGTRTRRSWRKLHVGVDADTGRIVAATLSTSNVDDASQVSALLDQTGPVASFTADGAYDQDGVYGEVARCSPDASVIVPPRSSAVPSETAGTAPTQRDRHLQISQLKTCSSSEAAAMIEGVLRIKRHQEPIQDRHWEPIHPATVMPRPEPVRVSP